MTLHVLITCPSDLIWKVKENWYSANSLSITMETADRIVIRKQELCVSFEKYHLKRLTWGKWFVVGIDCKMVGYHNITELYDASRSIDTVICCQQYDRWLGKLFARRTEKLAWDFIKCLRKPNVFAQRDAGNANRKFKLRRESCALSTKSF